MFRFRRMAFWLAALTLLGLVACDDREKGTTSSTSSAKPGKAASPIAAPKALLALGRVREASKTFARVRGLVAAGAESWAKNLDGMVVRAGIVPLTAMTDLRLDESVSFAVARRSKTSPLAWAVALPISSGSNLIHRLSRGYGENWKATEVDGVTFVAPPHEASKDVAYVRAVFAESLVIASDRWAAGSLGPYVSSQTLAEPELSSLKDDLHVRLSGSPQSWMVPMLDAFDFEAPFSATLGSVQPLLRDWLDGTSGGQVHVRLGSERVSVSVSLRADDSSTEKAWASRPSVRFADLEGLPSDTALLVATAQTDEQRQIAAKTRASALRSLPGVSFTSETTDVLDGALERIAKASEPAEQLGVRCTGVGLTGYLRGQTKAPRTLQASLLAINQRLVREPAVRRWLKQRQLLIAAKRKKVRGVTGDVWRLRLAPRPEARDRHRDPIDTLMHVRKASYFITTGRQPSETLRMLVLAAAQEDHAKLGEELKHVAPERTWFFAHADFDQWLACVDGTAATADRQRVTVALGANRKALELNLLADAALLRRWIAYLM